MTASSKRQHPDCPFIPMGERVILELIKEDTKKGLLYIPDQAVDAPKYAIVLALGELVVAEIEVGDKVSFGRYSGNILRDENDKEYLVLNADEILVKVKRD